MAVDHARAGLGEIKLLLGAGDADISQSALLVDLLGVHHRRDRREQPVLHARDEHHGELQALGAVERHHHAGVRVGVVVVDVGHQRDLLQKRGQIGFLPVVALEFDDVGGKLADIFDTPFALFTEGQLAPGPRAPRQEKPAGKDMYHLMTFLEGRKISLDTACVFSPFIHCVRDKQRDMKYPNLGFPYQRPGEDRVLGYEIRGYGSFKSKAPGTDSSTASWIVDLTPDGNPMEVENVYLAESAYDIMAFYQFNKCELHPEKSVFVSIGGTFSNGQIEGLRDYYRSAKFYDCFDNDLPGRIYGIRLAGLMSGSDFHVNKINMGVCIEFGNRKFILPNEKVRLSELGKKIRLSSRLGEWKAPPEFCDWNDVIMNRPMKEQEKMTKFQRNENLRQKRNPGLKI